MVAVIDHAARVHNLLKGISLPGQVEGDRPCRVPGGGEAASPGGGVAAWAGGGDWTRAGGGGRGWADCGGGEAAAPGGGDWTSSGGGEEAEGPDGGDWTSSGGGEEAAAPGGGDWTSAGGGEDGWAPGSGLGKTGIGGLLTCGSAMTLPRYMGLLATAVLILDTCRHPSGTSTGCLGTKVGQGSVGPVPAREIAGKPPTLAICTKCCASVSANAAAHTHKLWYSSPQRFSIQIHPSTAGGRAPAQQRAAAQQLFRCCWARSHCRAWARTWQRPAAPRARTPTVV